MKEYLSDGGVTYLSHKTTSTQKGPLVNDGKQPVNVIHTKVVFPPIKRWIDNLDPPLSFPNLIIFDL